MIRNANKVVCRYTEAGGFADLSYTVIQKAEFISDEFASFVETSSSVDSKTWF